jgi:hypothetical protein
MAASSTNDCGEPLVSSTTMPLAPMFIVNRLSVGWASMS